MKEIAICILTLFFVSTACSEKKTEIFSNIPYIKDTKTKRQKLDLYVPKSAKNAPVLVFIHGGAWRNGAKDKPIYKAMGRKYAEKGILFVAINYRLSPKYKHPKHVEDVAAALFWVKQNISKYGGDPKSIFVCGHSAGAHLTGLVMMDKRYLSKYNLKPKDFAGAIPISGPMEIDSYRTKTIRKWFKDAFGEDTSKWKGASPLNYVHKDIPPFLFIYGGLDPQPIRESSQKLHNLLIKKRVKSDFLIMKNFGHIRTITNAFKGRELKKILDFIERDKRRK